MTIYDKVREIQCLIAKTADTCGRKPEDIQSMAVSKGQPINKIEEAFQAGITEFGENYWQEAEVKILSLQNLPIHWHFIGPIQSNKAAMLARYFHWVHSLEREKVARLLSENRPLDYPPLNVCIQVNLDAEISKSGIAKEQLHDFALFVNQLPQLKLRGLMSIPKPCLQKEEQYQSLMRLSNLLETLNRDLHLSLDTLSMGMSDDIESAIRAGSTMLRIGRAIFGNRE